MSKNNLAFDIRNHKMLHDNVLIKAISPSEELSDDLVDPAQYEDKSEWGEVIAVGDGRITENGTLVKPTVKKGNIVLYGKYSTYKTRIKGEDFLILRADDIYSVYGN